MSNDKTERPAPKQARAIATRNKIVDAAIGCLRDLGYAGTSTTAVAKRAGVSQGALFKHFPAKPLLLATATERVFEEMRERFVVQVLARLEEGFEAGKETEIGLAVLWEIYTDPTLSGVFELYLATRTDPVLRGALEPVVTAHFDGILQIASLLFPAAAGTPRFEHAVTSIMLTLQGAAIMVGIAPDGHDARLPLDFLGQFMVAALGAPDPSALRDE